MDGKITELSLLEPGVIRPREHVPLRVVNRGEFRVRPIPVTRAVEADHILPDAPLRAGLVAVPLDPLCVLRVLGSEPCEVAQYRIARVAHSGADALRSSPDYCTVHGKAARVCGHAS